jgi:glycosyltransferase involved in cell wall biosynthesis
MRVLRVIPSLNPLVGGPAVAAVNSVVSAARQGIESEIAVVVRPGETGAQWWLEVERRCATEGVRLRAFPVSASRLAPHLYDPSAGLFRWLARLSRRTYDILHVESPWTAPCAIASLIATLRSIPVVLTPNAVFMAPDLRRGHVARRATKRLGLHLYSRWAAAVICSSPLEANEAIASGVPATKVTWTYLPVVDDRTQIAVTVRSTRGSGLRVGFLGRLHPSKNLDLLIDAIGRLDDSVTLQAAGRGDAIVESELVQRAARTLPGRADFTGWIDGADKRSFFSRIDLLAMPSEYECFGVAAVEALAAGVPVITTDRVGIADIVRTHGAGRIVSPTTTGFAEGLRAYVDDHGLLASHAANARPAAITETSYSTHGVRLAELYGRFTMSRS